MDLDEIPSYFAIHGLGEVPAASRHLVYDVALARLDELARALSVPLTCFAIGADLSRDVAANGLRALAVRGAEIANHTLDHRYDLTRLGRDEITRQIAGGAREIAAAVGEAPVGFRAPGYTITDEVFDVLTELGVTYDASVFPCPAYWAAKTTAIGLIRARGRVSRSVVDTPRVLAAPTRPYRVGKPYWKRGGGMLEIPVQVTRGPRLPFIGTSVTLAGPARARWLARACVGEPLVNLELHGIDLLDRADGLDALAPYQHDVRVPLGQKQDAIEAVIRTLKKAGYTFVTMREAAERFAEAA